MVLRLEEIRDKALALQIAVPTRSNVVLPADLAVEAAELGLKLADAV